MPALDPRALGELGLIEALRRRAGPAGRPWVRDIGDDAAVLRPRPGREIAVTIDTLVENVHFRWSTTDARSLGAKTLAVNLSDLGAMGAEPIGFVLSLGLPASASGERVDGVARGLLAASRAAGCPLVGGDTVRSDRWTLTVTALGDVPRGRALTRSGARPGDRVLVTGTLGGAALGLLLLEAGRGGETAARPFARRHLRPSPPWRAGARIARAGWASAAIDVSDGLLRDLGHVAAASGVACDIDVECVPLPRGLRARCAELRTAPESLALAGGEDYELLLCAPPETPSAQGLARRLGCRVTEIGRVRRGRGVRALVNGRPLRLAGSGWDHFKGR